MKHPPNISVCLDIDCDIPVAYFTPSATDWFIKNVTEDDEIEYVPASLLEESRAKARVLVSALENIMEPYQSDWTLEQCITALRHDEHESRTALAKFRGEK